MFPESLSLNSLKNHVLRTSKLFFFTLIVLSLEAGSTMAQSKSSPQSQKRIIQLSGVTIAKDSIMVPGVHIYVPKAGRGTVSTSMGYFSLAVLPGDSVVISSVGFKRQSMIVPNSISDFVTIVVEMVEDVTYLQEVKIMAFPTEEVFKEAVLALNIPMETGLNQRNLNAELLALMMRSTAMDGNLNYRYYIDQYANSVNDKYQPRTNPFLNPFNWAKFFKQLKETNNNK
jgi:hypothetical protein